MTGLRRVDFRRRPLAGCARAAGRSSSGFTLIEVLATLMLMAIVLPAVMQGITLATNAASTARHRTEATGLAQSKLAEAIATGEWSGGAGSGDFSPDWPDYKWEMSVGAQNQNSDGSSLQQLDIRVFWQAKGGQDSVTLSTLVFTAAVATATTGS